MWKVSEKRSFLLICLSIDQEGKCQSVLENPTFISNAGTQFI